MKKGRLYWITGLAGAGKTLIGTALYYKLREKIDNIIMLDGDSMKNIVNDNKADFSYSERKRRAWKYAHMCKLLTDQGMYVICSTISMFHDIQKWNRENNTQYVEIFLNVSLDILKKRDSRCLYSKYEKKETTNVVGMDIPAEFPENPDVVIENDGRYTVKECVNKIIQFKADNMAQETNDVSYWDNYYANINNAPEEPSLFAKFIMEKYLKNGGRLLELGCGNGRDSLYFSRNGLDVVALDTSSEAIKKLNDIAEDSKLTALFACDDFTNSNAIFQQRFDYCYSRFTLHSITENQEINVIKNIYSTLNNCGLFFIEARSVHDEIYGKGQYVGDDSYIYEGHFRRFLRKENFERHLKRVGFHIIYSEESRGFAPFKNIDSPVIRVIAKK
ncbi:MAG: adenylyl-sulfate kinase [Lachnospiraceae bacterium]|nr:adenylyl-sulfate kinase [Lachnospiraceae bacterium]